MSKKYIKKVHLLNFKGFQNQRVEGLNDGINILIGDNDTGKSSILLAIELVLSCNANKVESIGLDKLFNIDAINDFMDKEKRLVADMPEMEIDVYLNEQGRHEYEGEGNIDEDNAYGVALICRPNSDAYELIQQVISQEEATFPYEYYSVEIKTFGGHPLSSYKRPMELLSIDNTKISNDYAARAHIRSVYKANTDTVEQNRFKYQYRNVKERFSKEQFDEVNKKLEKDYSFTVKNSSKANLETDLTISRSGIDIENLGVGAQCFIRTSFALSKKSNIDVVLLEEPENHLSHTNMRRLIDDIKSASQSQIFIATHNSLICSKLDLRHAILFSKFWDKPISLGDLPESTADFFMKAPSSAVLEYVLSSKNILVEGDAEYILLPAFYNTVTGSTVEKDGVHVISIGGISFPRYLDIAALLNIRTAVITDNDGDIESLKERYKEYEQYDHISIYYDSDEDRSTFEKCVYRDNEAVCESLFSADRKKLTVEQFMLKNKSRVAYELSTDKASELIAPDYLNKAVQWIRS